jgi:ATP-dependent RNA helicase DeaD
MAENLAQAIENVMEVAKEKISQVCQRQAGGSEAEALVALCGGSDVQLYAEKGRDRTFLYGAYLAGVSGISVVVTSSVEEAGAVADLVSQCVTPVIVCSAKDDIKKGLEHETAVLVVTPTTLVEYSKSKGAQLSLIARCVVDSVDSIISLGVLGDLESSLVELREASPEAQLVIIGGEPSLNISALSRRFMREPKSCSIRGVVGQAMQHEYFEVGTSLLAKPQALCDIIELEAGSSSIVFCNSPSDADFADVILKKRGISSVKLIGYVPQLKLSKAVQNIQKGEVSVLVLTDVAARGIPLEEFEVVINYSVPTDPEVYFHRYAGEGETKTRRVVSLVAPLDIANFHYLKKLGKLEFVQSELPGPEQLFVTKFGKLREQALEKSLINDPSLAALADKVIADGSARDIVALLLHNTLSVMPSMKTAAPAREEYAAEESEEQEYEERPDRRGRGEGGQRGGRGRRQQRGRGSEEDRQPRAEDEYETRGEGEEGGRRGRRRGWQDSDKREEGRERDQNRRQSRRPQHVERDARLYVGAGLSQGLSGDAISQMISEVCGVESAAIRRLSVRNKYAFVDVPEAVADQVIEKMSTQTAPQSGEKLLVKRAITVSITKEGAPEEQPAETETGDMHHDETGIDEGPTLLAVDDSL